MRQQLLVFSILGLLVPIVLGVPVTKNTATNCDPTVCVAPDCRCSSTETPGGLAKDEIPHFVILSFDDGVTVSNHPFYETLQKRKNPNGCDIRMTFYVSHENSDYTLVNDLYRHGHEIAVHSVTHKADVENYWRPMTKEQWAAEMNDQKAMLTTYGVIPEEDIKGFRAPFLEVGGDSMYEALHESGFEYDCSWASLQYTPWYVNANGTTKGALWPYTLDYGSIQDQTVGTKPTKSIPGMWVAPMTDLIDNRNVECSMLDACQSFGNELDTSARAVNDLLKRNFNAHYNDRTPFGIYTHHSWFLIDESNNNTVKQDGFQMFFDYLEAYNHAYVVSVEQLMAWVKDPVPVSELPNHPAFKCSDNLKPDYCQDKINCQYKAPLPINQQTVYMKICGTECPKNYPYLNNVDGGGVYSTEAPEVLA